VGNHGEKRLVEDLVVDGRLMLKWALKKWVGRAWAGLIWCRIGTSDGLWRRRVPKSEGNFLIN
jgi:hypothetical protein